VVPVTAVAANATAATIMATIGVQNMTADVRVLTAVEQPTTVTIAPLAAAVAQGGTVAMTVTLNIPALGNTDLVGITITQGGGTVPATVSVAADKRTATFNFVHVSGDTVKVRAAFAATTSEATITLSTGANHLVINEVDYDQAVNPDGAEFIEIYNPSAASIQLANLQVLLVNGSNGTVYATINLADAGASLGAGKYLVIAGPNITAGAGALMLNPGWTTDEIQNGPPDGIALINNATHTLIDALSYEGSMLNIDLPGFAAPEDLVEGTATSVGDLTPFTSAMCRKSNGQDTDVAMADWALCAPTPGADNL